MAYRRLSALALFLAAAACSHGSDGAASSNDAITADELPIVITDTSIVAGTFAQTLDHTPGATDTTTFTQRYWYSTEFATGPDSPVILHICGEYECDQTYLQRLADVAKGLHASVVTLEHRFYGQSLPFGDRPTNDQYAYLTISQALDDIAGFVAFAKATLPLKGGWIAAGGSYAGMLAAFVREKHPEAIAGAWASSAPVNVAESFYGYDAVSSLALGKPCGDLLRFAMAEVPAMLADPAQSAALVPSFVGPDATWFTSMAPADQASMIQGEISGEAMNFAQVGTGGTQLCSALAQYPTFPLQGMAGYFNPPLVGDDDDDDTSDAGTPVDTSDAGAPVDTDAGTPANAPVATSALSVLGPGGAQVAAAFTLSGLKDAADSAPPGPPPGPLPPEVVADRAWNYEACNEMGFFFTSNPDPTNSIMEPSAPDEVQQDEASCLKRTGKTPNIAATLATYVAPITSGQTTNILFVNGSFDPWSSLSFTDPTHAPAGTNVYVIAQGHHHEELESLTPTSLLGEFESHKLLHDLAVQWLAAPASTSTPTPAPADAGATPTPDAGN